MLWIAYWAPRQLCVRSIALRLSQCIGISGSEQLDHDAGHNGAMRGRGSIARRVAVACIGGIVVWGFVWAWKSLHDAHGQDAASVASIVSLAVTILGVAISLAPLLRQPVDLGENEITSAAQNLAAEVSKREAGQLPLLIGRTDQKIDTRFVFDPAPSQNAANAPPEGELDQVLHYYSGLSPRRLVITGNPGAGKTVLAIELMLALLQKRKRDDPVPVRLALTTWDITMSVESWLVRQLAKDYEISIQVAEKLVATRRILPVLDGLDEMDSAQTSLCRSAQAVQRLNEYWGYPHLQGVVVTCRTEHYRELQASGHRILNSAQVRIEELTSDQICSYLTRRAVDPKRWRKVIERINARPGGRLARALSTPWWLTLAATVYEADRDLDPGALLSLPLEDIRQHLLGSYIPAVVASHPRSNGRRYSEEQVSRWLSSLASHLSRYGGNVVCGREQSRVDIVLYQLWPIAGRLAPRLGDTAFCAIASTPGLLWAASFSLSRDAFWVAVFLAAACLYLGLLVRAGMDPWPEPQRIDVGALKSRKAIPQVAFGLSIGMLAGVVFGALAGVLLGLGAWFAVGLSSQSMRGLGSASLKSAKKPFTPLSDDRLCGIVAALGVSPAIGLAFSVNFGRPLGVVLGLIYGITVGSSISSLWGRYLVTLVLAHGRLPWRTAEFMEWAYEAGLLRISGVAYQFRHQELANWLSRSTP